MPCIDISSLSNAKKDVEKYGCEWKDWYYEKAISPKNSVEDIRFWYTEGKSQIEEVPVCMIVGQDHDRYNSRQEEPVGLPSYKIWLIDGRILSLQML